MLLRSEVPPELPRSPAHPSRFWPRRPSRRQLLVLGLIAVASTGIAIAGWFTIRSSGTVADSLPAEARAFVSVAGGSPAARALSAAAAAAFGRALPRGIEERTLSALLFLGPDPAAPIQGERGRTLPGLLVHGVDLTVPVETGLAARRVPDGTLLVPAAADALRLGGRALGRDRSLRALLRALRPEAAVRAVFRPDAFAEVLRPLTVRVSEGSASVALTVGFPDETGSGTAAVTVEKRYADAVGALVAAESVGAVELVGRLPDTVVFAIPTTRAAIVDVLRSLFEGSTPLALKEEDAARDALAASLSDPGVAGVLPSPTQADTRDAVGIFRAADAEQATRALRDLERAALRVGALLGHEAEQGAAFADREYNGVQVRYVNFGSPARSVDYALLDNLLLVATSRESMFALIDAVRGSGALGATSSFAALRAHAGATGWVFVRPRAAAAAISPPQNHEGFTAESPVTMMLAVVEALLVERTGDGRWSGRAILSSSP